MKLTFNDKTLSLSETQIMGILNVTPDSFSDGGRYNVLSAAIQHASDMVRDGATIVDIGGESSRPGAMPISVEEELQRVIPVVEALSQRIDVWISVDTSKPEVMRAAAAAGAHIINDIRSLNMAGAVEAVSETGLLACLTHMQGEPATMQQAPCYEDVVAEVSIFFHRMIERCTRAGISREKIIIDPGFGMGKTLTHNYQMLAELNYLHHYRLPVMAGMSRKSMVSKLTGKDAGHCLSGSIAAAVIASLKGAQIVRVHDVKETREALEVVNATLMNKY